MMQNFGLEDLLHVQSQRNLLKYLVRVEMASDWLTRIYRSILAEQISSKIEIGRANYRLRALLEPATSHVYRKSKRSLQLTTTGLPFLSRNLIPVP